MSNSSDETVEIGKKVLHALNNSGYVSVSDPHRVIIATVLLDLRLIHGITPDTPPGDPDFEIPLIVHLVGKNCRAAPPCRPPPVARRASRVDPPPARRAAAGAVRPCGSWLFPLALCGLALWATWGGSVWVTFVWLLLAWNVGRFGPALLLSCVKGVSKLER